MREYLAVLRAALQGQASFEGRYYRVRWTGAFQAPAPPVLLAGLAPPMLELAGELADGVVLWLCGPAYVRDVAIPALARGRARASKALEGFEVVAAVPLAVTEDHAGVARLFREELCRYLALPYYRTMFRRERLRRRAGGVRPRSGAGSRRGRRAGRAGGRARRDRGRASGPGGGGGVPEGRRHAAGRPAHRAAGGVPRPRNAGGRGPVTPGREAS